MNNVGQKRDPIAREIEQEVPWAIEGVIFTSQFLGTGPWQDQGWKLHISATPESAVDILRAVLPYLLKVGVRFKIAKSMAILRELNGGQHGISQIGKFVTVYPSDNTQAVELAVALDELTRTSNGPRIPSDRPLRPGSMVHYRYGSMRPRREQVEHAELDRFDLLDGAGRLTQDVRQNFFVTPEFDDPFVAAGVYSANSHSSTLLNGRFLIVDALSQSPRGGIFRAIDMSGETARVCVLKEFWHDVAPDEFGRNSYAWADNEARILSSVNTVGLAPELIDSFEFNSNRYLALEYVGGVPLDRVIEDAEWNERGAPLPELIKIGMEVADQLVALHAKGFIFRDVKPENVIVCADGHHRLIDFGIAYAMDAGVPDLRGGSTLFCSPDQHDGALPQPADDIFAWGALLHYLACGSRSLAGQKGSIGANAPFARIPVADLVGSIPPQIAATIDRATAWRSNQRFATIAEARHEFSIAAASPQLTSKRSNTARDSVCDAAPHSIQSREELIQSAKRIGDRLCDSAQIGTGGTYWTCHAEDGLVVPANPFLYDGAAGIGLFLVELAHETSIERYAQAAREVARWVAGPIWGQGIAQHGLHCGEAGTALFFVRLAQLLDQTEYLTAADLRLRRLEGAISQTEDLSHGTAGTLLSYLKLFAVTHLPRHREAALELGRSLIDRAQSDDGSGGLFWKVRRPDHSGIAEPLLGLFHGSAGIGLALLELGILCSEPKFVEAAHLAARFLLSRSFSRRAKFQFDAAGRVSQIRECEALHWPKVADEDDTNGLQATCHGAGGIVQFLVRLNRSSPSQIYSNSIREAANAVMMQAAHESRTGLCHGLSGAGNVLIDCYQSQRTSDLLKAAQLCAEKIDNRQNRKKSGSYFANRQNVVSSDLMIGYAGIGSFLLRLADPLSSKDIVLQ